MHFWELSEYFSVLSIAALPQRIESRLLIIKVVPHQAIIFNSVSKLAIIQILSSMRAIMWGNILFPVTWINHNSHLNF